MWLYNICFVLIYFYVNGQIISSDKVVLNVGSVLGIKGMEFTSYLGIPYGVVRDGKPFDTATPAPAFKTTYYADKDPVICPQVVKGIPQGSIHCLNLNVYTPNNVTSNSSLPVMVFIHGGGFVEGDGNLKTYSPRFLVKKNVIIVSVNYRLGPYGFICMPKTNYSNQGLKDQALAFDWVKHNIKYFGGDNNDITIFGHSAGSGSAELHLLFNKNKIFNKVILQSGFVVSPFMLEEAANEEYIKKLAKKVNIDVNNMNIDDIIKKLSDIDVNKLIGMTGSDIFRPCVDEVFVNKTPNIDLKGIKVMIGATLKEMVFFYNDNEPAFHYFNYLANQSISKVKNYYLKGLNVKDGNIDLGTDFFFKLSC